jgi:hypothetical protein
LYQINLLITCRFVDLELVDNRDVDRCGSYHLKQFYSVGGVARERGYSESEGTVHGKQSEHGAINVSVFQLKREDFQLENAR